MALRKDAASEVLIRAILSAGALLAAIATPCLAQGGGSSSPVFRYSTITRTFDGLMPIGVAFEIRGTAVTGIDAVRVESFGYQHAPPPAFRAADIGSSEFCAALKGARNDAQKTVVHTSFAWDRTAPGDVEFTTKHPRLYFGRNYVFVFTYFRKVDQAAVRTVLATKLTGMIEQAAEFKTLLLEGRTGAEIQANAERVMREIRNSERSCGPLFIARGAGDIERFWERTRVSLARIIGDLATKRHLTQQLEQGPAIGARLKTALAELPPAVREKPEPKAAIAAVLADIDSTDWVGAVEAFSQLLVSIANLETTGAISAADAGSARRVLSLPMRDVSPLRGAQEAIGRLVDLPKAVADSIAADFKPGEFDEILSAATVLPYFQTMKESLPFLISLDGGLLYVERFRQLVPVVGANVKLNRVDFDDPLDRRNEFSALIGMGLSSPDDLDPDYEGIFSGSNRSLWLGLGLRPGGAPMLRAHLGMLLYRQQDVNPLQKDFHTKASVTFGLSANWDALDFAAKLIKGRPTLGAGGL